MEAATASGMIEFRASKEELASRIEHTVLIPSIRWLDVERVLQETESYGFRCSVVPPHMVAEAAAASTRPVCTVAGFPFGYQPTVAKLAELEAAAEAGAVEVDVVMNLSAFLDGRIEYVRRELELISHEAHSHGIVLKVILETGLIGGHVEEAALIVADSGADYVKTCTGFGPRGATLEDVLKIRRAIGGKAKVKAAGGIRETVFALQLLAAGADTIGTSSGPRIVEGLEKLSDLG